MKKHKQLKTNFPNADSHFIVSKYEAYITFNCRRGIMSKLFAHENPEGVHIVYNKLKKYLYEET